MGGVNLYGSTLPRPLANLSFYARHVSKVKIGFTKGFTMHKQEDALKILNCSKATLSRYAKDGRLNVVKKGRNTFYDEHEVAVLVLEIEANKKRVGIEIKPKEKIELPKEAQKNLDLMSANSELNQIGIQALQTATADLCRLGLYDDCDKQILLMYALNHQAYNRFFVLAMEMDAITSNEAGNLSVHPYHKVMQYHEKQMMQCMDRLGLNPLSRQKFTIEPKKEIDEMEALLA